MIPAITELNFPTIDGKQYVTLTQATANLADMGEKTITTQVKIDGGIVPDFSEDWEVAFQGEKYIMPLRIPQGAKGNDSLNSTIDLTFQHWAVYQLKRFNFTTIQQIAAGTYLPDEEVAPVQLNLKDFCILFGQVLEYYYAGAITIDLNPAWQYKQAATLIEISHTKIWNVLIDAFHDKYGVRWEIVPASDNDNTVKGGERYVIRVGYPTTEVDHIFEYGFEGGLLKVERQVQSEEIRNILKGRGGETNIPFRYFKNTDPNNPDFKPDPDWVEELADIPFTNLMPATFRSYVQGWKTAHINQTGADGKKIYAAYTPVDEANAYAPWAYRKGYTDTKFAPIEFVADEITINPTSDDKQVEILPNYSPYVKKGSSLDKYGALPDTLDNNDDIYPTLQGTGLDIAVDVEQIESDDVEESIESDAKPGTLPGEVSALEKVEKNQRVELVIRSRNFTVESGKTANLDEGTKNIILTKDMRKVVWRYNGKWGLHVETFQVPVEDENVTIEDASLVVVNVATGQEISASGITGGTYCFRLSLTVYNTATETYNVSVECPEPKLTSATLTDDKWRNTFDIWVKNIWGSSKYTTETDAQYSERVWKPVLGDREGNKAKVVFTSGDLALSEDYEFTIVDFPAPDASKTWKEKDSDGNITATHTSHWRIKLAKSDAELEATGLYVPSKQKQGKAGDTFVFIGTEMTHNPYVTDAEIRLADYNKDQLGEVMEIKPTAVVTTDRVRLNNEGKPDALINQLRVGNSLRLFDKRFFNEEGKAYETLYLQSITYTYREPTSDDAALNPDVEIVLGNDYTTSANPVSMMQSEISALQKQVGSISNIQQVVRAVGDKLYLRKDGISDRSLSPTQFFSLLTSGDFRAGLVGGAGWGFYKDENGNWVLETDRMNVRQEMQVNTLVINQAEGRGGMQIDTAAYIDGVTRVVETADGYVCYFDQKGGSVANLFHVDDVAYCNQWTPENADLKFYKRRVTAVGTDSITLSKTDVNGTGIPAEGDNIIHFGNYTDATRQYVKVRDVVSGGYERYIEALDSVNAAGVEYYFVGKQAGQSRWFVGNKDLVPYSGAGDGAYMEYIDGDLKLNNVTLSVGSTVGEKTIDRFVADNLNMGVTNIVKLSGEEHPLSISSPVSYDLSENIAEGHKYTLSVWGIQHSTTGGLRVWLVNDGENTVLPYPVKQKDGFWKLTFDGKSANGLWLSGTGRFSMTVQRVKLERGTVGTDWSAAPSDEDVALSNYDYLRVALEESTTISGGLVVASLMQLGYSVDDGFIVKSGINGIYDDTDPDGGIALWAGGSMADVTKQDESIDPATFVVRMNGTGYMANGTIKFEQDRLLLGDSLVVSDAGLEMVTEDGVALTIKDEPIGYSSIANASTEKKFSINKSVNITNVWYSPTSQSRYVCSTFPVQRIDLGSVQGGASIAVGVKIETTVDYGVGPGLVIPKRNMGRMVVQLKNKADESIQMLNGGTWVQVSSSGSVVKYHIDITSVTTVDVDGDYWLEIYALDIYSDNGWVGSSTSGGTSLLTGTAELNGSSLRRLIVGNNGFAANWGKSLLCCDDDGVLMRRGNRYIGFYDSGIKINRNDGKGEVNL